MPYYAETAKPAVLLELDIWIISPKTNKSGDSHYQDKLVAGIVKGSKILRWSIKKSREISRLFIYLLFILIRKEVIPTQASTPAPITKPLEIGKRSKNSICDDKGNDQAHQTSLVIFFSKSFLV